MSFSMWVQKLRPIGVWTAAKVCFRRKILELGVGRPEFLVLVPSFHLINSLTSEKLLKSSSYDTFSDLVHRIETKLNHRKERNHQ